jgi:hypothetical protein
VVDAGVIYVNAHPRSDARVVEDLQDPRRIEPPFLLGERDMLEAWLEFHRTTLLLKCEGLADAGRKGRPVPTSKLSLHGLVRHLAEVERNWFRRVLLDDRLAPPIWADPAAEDSELVPSMMPTGKPTWPPGRPSATPVGLRRGPMSWTTPVCGTGSRARCGGSMST